LTQLQHAGGFRTGADQEAKIVMAPVDDSSGQIIAETAAC
jgi:hypothetical protein